MKPIELNLAGNPYRNDTPLLAGLGVLAAAALLFTAYNAFGYLTADSKRDALVDQLADHRAQMEAMRQEEQEIRAALGKFDADILQAQADLVSRVLNERNFSWTGLLNQLEGVLPWNVRLSSIRPQFGDSNVTVVDLRGTAMDVDAFYALQDSLENSPRFTDVQPGSWQLLSRGMGNDERISFNIQCRYLPPSDEERAAAGPAGSSPPGAADDVIVVDDLPGELDAEPQPESFAAENGGSEPVAAGRSAPAQRPAQGVVTRPSRKAAGAASNSGDAATPRTKRRNAMRTSGEPVEDRTRQAPVGQDAGGSANLPLLSAPVAGGPAAGDSAPAANNPRATRSGSAPPGAAPAATVPGAPRPPGEAPSADDPAVEVTEDGKIRYRRPFPPQPVNPAGGAAPQSSGDGTASGGGR